MVAAGQPVSRQAPLSGGRIMRNRYALSFLPLIALAIVALPSLPGLDRSALAQQAMNGNKPEMTPRGERKAREIKYGDWQKVCFKTPGSNMVCRTNVNGVWSDTGQSAVRV